MSKDDEGHVHTHGDLSKKEDMVELLDAAHEAAGIPAQGGSARTAPAEVVFRNRQRIGDTLMFTCGVRDFKKAFPNTRVNVVSTAMHIWDHNPYLDRSLRETPENVIKIGPGWGTNASNRIDWHFANAYRISIEQALGLTIPQGESRPDIWLTEEEYHAPRLFKQPYWIICVNGEKSWGCKMYPFERWQHVIKQMPDITFVQIGTKGDKPPRLQGSNVIDYVGMTEDRHTGIRDAFKLFLNAEGSIGLVSFHMHLSGALYKPAVVVAGAREPVSFTRYQGHAYLANDGTLPCAETTACWHCGIDTCTNLVDRPQDIETRIPKCVDMIEPVEVIRAIRSYYKGGRLQLDKPAAKPKFQRVVPTPPKPVQVEVPAPPPEDPMPDVAKMGMSWNGPAITEQDWKMLRKMLKQENVKTVLEFGAGLSSVLFSEASVSLTSYETQHEWIDRVKQLAPGAQLRWWNGVDAPDLKGTYDLAFVDGPANGETREQSIRLAAEHARILIVDDGDREHEQKWQQIHLDGKLEGPFHVGSRCHLWLRKEAGGSQKGLKYGQECRRWANRRQATQDPFSHIQAVSKPLHVKIVSTARGWGGCARSITTIMKLLQKAGHRITFVPFRNRIGSREFKQELEVNLRSVSVMETYDSIRQPCDVLLVYADDFVWEFEKPEIAQAFSELQATRKVMMLNYRRGGVGEIPWTRGWDKYMFLNSTQEKELLKVHPGVETKVLPPCTDLSRFFEAKPNYNTNLRIVRHNSQGDAKFDKAEGDRINAAMAGRPEAEIHMMPGPSWVQDHGKFKRYPKNVPAIPQFLAIGNLFWYSLPGNPPYMDMGPRVVLEAMAAGLPVLADPWGGAVDRVTEECGWLCGKAEQLQVIRSVTPEELQRKGEAARRRAKEEFVPDRWLGELTANLV